MTPPLSKLTYKDLFFAGINGAIFGVMVASITANLDIQLLRPNITILIFIFLAIFGIWIGHVLSRYITPFFFQLAKFGAVGASNFSVDIGTYSLLIFITGTVIGPLIPLFKGISFIIAVINSYLWNKFWSFERNSQKTVGKEFVQFLAVSVIGMTFNVGITHIMVNITGSPIGIGEKLWATISALFAAIFVLTWNFIGYKFIVFRDR